MKTLKFGVLSTASVNSYAFLPVIKKVPGAALDAIASRDLKKARAYAKKHGIPKAYGDYDSLLADPEITCVYIPLPVSMHAEWSSKAMDAGKHVLCEKPVAANEAEALAIAEKAEATGLTFAEAFHYLYHPLMGRVTEIVRSGGIGELVSIAAVHGVPLTDRNKVQFKPELAGGALLDIGCYPVNFARVIAGCDDARALEAVPKMTRSGVDGSMRASLEFESGVRADINCSLVGYLPMSAVVRGTKGAIYLLSPFNPAVALGPACVDIYLIIHQRGLEFRGIRVPTVTSYQRQLESFCEDVRAGAAPLTNAREAAANMRLIDAIYEKAGMR